MVVLTLPATALLCLSALASAQEPVSILRVGDPIPGVGQVTGIEQVIVSAISGNWSATVSTDNPAIPGAILGKGGVQKKVGDVVIASSGATVRSFGGLTEDVWTIQSWIAKLAHTPGGSSDNEAVFFDLGFPYPGILLQTGSPASGPVAVFPPGTVWTSFADYQSWPLGNGALLRGTVEDPTLPGTDETFVARASMWGSIGVCCELDLIAEEGTLAPGLPETIEHIRTEAWARIDYASSRALWSCDLSGGATSDGAVWLYVSGPGTNTLIAREGSPSPVPGRNWGPLDAPSVDLGKAAAWTLRAELDATDPASDEIIVRTGLKFAQEGDAHPAIAPFVLAGFGTGRAIVRPDGQLLWYARWNDTAQPAEGIFLGQQLLVRAGVTTVGGVPIVDLESGPQALAMSESGQYLVFQGRRAGGPLEAFLLDLGGMNVYCTSKHTSQGCFPSIGWTGTLPSASQGSGFVVQALSTPGPAAGLCFYGTNGAANVPLQNGTLCVAGPIRRLPTGVGGGNGTCFGALQVDFNAWIASGADPALVPGQWVHTQFRFKDPGYAPPNDYGLTRGLEFFILP